MYLSKSKMKNLHKFYNISHNQAIKHKITAQAH